MKYNKNSKSYDIDIESRVEELNSLSKLSKEQAEELSILEKRLALDLQKTKKEHAEELKQIAIENAKEEGDVQTQLADKLEKKYKNIANGIASVATEAVSNLETQLDNTINNYISKQTQMSAHLIGSNTNLASITDTLSSVLSTSSLVKQETVYNKLSTLLSEGITYNVEQRAFLSSLADDIDLVFNDTNGSLSRLIRLQNNDLTANRLAIEYSLQKFLNQNYETSEYIKEAYSGVSDAILESQSLMSASDATAYETMIQTWLGSYYSTGMSGSTVNSLASAINALGSGDVSNLGSGISNLIVMGAAKAGLDFGEMLTNGINAEDVNELMIGITSYLTEMGAQESNVAKNQLSKIFGVSVSDLVAAQNYTTTSASGSVSSDISTLLNEYSDLIPVTTQISNTLANFMYSWGTNIASDSTSLLTYKATQIIGNLGKSIGSGIDVKLGGLSVDLGSLIKLGSFGVGTLLPLLSTIGSIYDTASQQNGGSLLGIFNALGGSSVAGSTVKVSNEGVSGSMYMNTGDTSSMLNSSINSLSQTGVTEAITSDEEEIDYDQIISDNVNSILTEIRSIGDTVIDIRDNMYRG